MREITDSLKSAFNSFKSTYNSISKLDILIAAVDSAVVGS